MTGLGPVIHDFAPREHKPPATDPKPSTPTRRTIVRPNKPAQQQDPAWVFQNAIIPTLRISPPRR
jgi:hypothetical protein